MYIVLQNRFCYHPNTIQKIVSMKSSFKTCGSGHFYPSSKDSCPYCSGGDGLGRTEFTTPLNEQPTLNRNQPTGGDKTEIIGSGGSNSGKGFGKQEQTEKINNMSNSFGNNSDKTGIYRPETESNNDKNSGTKDNKNIAARKLVGWLVSYTLNEFGIDFRLYEGQNTVGRDFNSNIRIAEDSLISSKHGTLLYRGANLYYKDEMSTNPSFLNEVEIMPGETVKIKDGDCLKLGNNDYMVRLALLQL
jgi:hypothetical protein